MQFLLRNFCFLKWEHKMQDRKYYILLCNMIRSHEILPGFARNVNDTLEERNLLPRRPGKLHLDDVFTRRHPKISTPVWEWVIYRHLRRHGLRRLYFPPSGKSTWLKVLVAPASRLSGAVAHVPGLLWMPFCATFSSSAATRYYGLTSVCYLHNDSISAG